MSDPPPEPVSDSEAQPDVPPWPAWTVPAAIILGLGLGTVATILVELVGAAGGSSLSHPSPAVSIAGDIVFDLSFVAAALYFAFLGRRASLANFGFRPAAPRRAVAAFVLAVIGYYAVTAMYGAIFRLHGQDKLPSELGVTHSTAALVGAAIFVCVVAPIAEELFFRGFVFGALRHLKITVAGRDLGVWLAAVLTGILFGLVHLSSAPIQYLIPLGFLGFVLCLVRWRTASLYPCIALHSANNALALGVNQLGWNAGEIIALIVGAWLIVAAITGPLAVRAPRLV
ncbi:MAG: protease family protein [Solirubrobacteraceae bacterium]|jgi:membrane protease YdiL (CAAX protease family)|nr:protease family protein [Solirubrobacteraceae bacterium]